MKTYRHKDLGLFPVTYTPSRWVPDGTGGGRRVYDPSVTVRVRILIDLETVAANLGPKAIKSKARRARYLHGALIVAA